MRAKKVLITGFDAFGNNLINPSGEVVEATTANFSHLEVHKLILPTVFEKSLAILKKEAFFLNPDYIICFGLNEKAQEVNLEVLAHNLNDASIPDNEGNCPVNEVIFERAAATLDSTLPIGEIEDALLAAQIPVAISRDCGRFVCNHVFYGIRHIIEEKKMRAKAGFVHLPSFETMGLADQVEALEVILAVLNH